MFNSIQEKESLLKRIERLEAIIQESHLAFLPRLTDRLVRLEILSYYAHEKRRSNLCSAEQATLEYLEMGGPYLNTLPDIWGRENILYSEYVKDIAENTTNGLYYKLVNGHPLYLSHDMHQAQQIWWALKETQWKNHPHCYFDASSGFEIPQEAIVADIGAAEGLIALQYIEHIKKAYLFEFDPYWIPLLQQTFLPFKDKVEIIQLPVGDGESGTIRLDDFFKDKEPPTFIKMDIEGMEGRALSGMHKILFDNKKPLSLALCTYHKQHDARDFEELLKNYFKISYSPSLYWHFTNAEPPYFRHGIMRAVKI